MILSKNGTVVNTKYGKVEGFATENGTHKWFGIPFGKPPIGDLRFKRSEPAEPWYGVRKCDRMGAGPYQFANKMLDELTDSKNTPYGEDCLSLNIWAPQNANKAPVFIWIYGGGNHVGDAHDNNYQLDSFPEHDIIGVSFNYRVGPLGFYDFSYLDDSFDSNCSISDMILAVRWVHENIEAFGGDPTNITICGESAGGTAVYSLLSAPSARGTFQRAIAMSGLSGNITTRRTHELNHEIFFRKLGIKPNEVSKLKEMSYEQMFDAGVAVFTESNIHNPGIFATGPVIDDLIPQEPWKALASGSAEGISCIFGTCHDEGSLFYMNNGTPTSWDKVEEMLRNNNRSDLLPDLRRVYHEEEEKKAMIALGGDKYFWADSIKCSLAQLNHGPVYSYRFDAVVYPFGMGAMHGSDIQVALNTGAKDESDVSKHVKKLSETMHGAFINFAKTGNPNGNLPIEWKQYDENERATFIFDDTCRMVCNPNRERFDIWEGVELYM